jgi:hypothetical protein
MLRRWRFAHWPIAWPPLTRNANSCGSEQARSLGALNLTQPLRQVAPDFLQVRNHYRDPIPLHWEATVGA